jgi:hypothetical protein
MFNLVHTEGLATTKIDEISLLEKEIDTRDLEKDP